MRNTLILILCLALSGAPGLLKAQSTGDHPVKLVLKDGTIVSGDLLGVEDGEVTLQLASGKSKDIALDKVKKAFDTNTGKPIKLEPSAAESAEPASSQPAQTQAQTQSSDDEEEAKPARKPRPAHHSNGRKVAGNITLGVSAVVCLVGVLMAGYGSAQMSDATSTYYTGPNNYAGAYYNIGGKYYTYSQYTEYYYGQDWAYAGLTIGGVGLVGMIAGLIISSSGGGGDAMLHYEDKQVALAIPPIEMNPRTGGWQATLATARF